VLRSLYHLSQRLLRLKKSRRLEEVSGVVSTPFGMLRAQPPMQTNKISEVVPQEASVALVGAKEAATTTTMGAASTVGSKATCLGNALSRRRREASVEASEGPVEEPEMAVETWAGGQGPNSTTIDRVRKGARLDGAALFNRTHPSSRHQHGVLRLTHP
jgi:hypothetical protein